MDCAGGGWGDKLGAGEFDCPRDSPRRNVGEEGERTAKSLPEGGVRNASRQPCGASIDRAGHALFLSSSFSDPERFHNYRGVAADASACRRWIRTFGRWRRYLIATTDLDRIGLTPLECRAGAEIPTTTTGVPAWFGLRCEDYSYRFKSSQTRGSYSREELVLSNWFCLPFVTRDVLPPE